MSSEGVKKREGALAGLKRRASFARHLVRECKSIGSRLWEMDRRLRSLQEAVGRIEARQLEAAGVTDLEDAEFRVYSQWGEDGVIRRAAVFVGIDSGPAHLANAVGTPGVILLGRYKDYGAYMPYTGGYGDGSNALVLNADGPVRLIEPGAVVAGVEEVLRG